MVTAWPAMVTVPTRDAAPVLAGICSVTLPLPAPNAPLVMLIQVAAPVAVQPHPVGAVTVTVTDPPGIPNAWLSGATV